MTPASVIPAPPSTATYPITALNLFPTIYWGTGAPPYDPTKPQQSWSDPAAVAVIAAAPELATAMRTYYGYIPPTPNAKPVYTSFLLPYGDAARINLPTAAQLTPGGEYANLAGAVVTPIPARALLPDESIIPSPMPGAPYYVGNTANGYSAPGTPAGTTATGTVTTNELEVGIQEIEGALGLPKT